MAETWLLLKKELLLALRDRRVVIYSILFPLFLYPLLFFGISQIQLFQEGRLEHEASRIALLARTPTRLVLRALRKAEELDLMTLEGPEEGDFESLLREKTADAVLVLDGDGDESPFRIFYLSSVDRSAVAKERLETVLETVRKQAVATELEKLGVNRRASEIVHIHTADLASAPERGRFVLGMLLPLFFVIILGLGAIYPAIEAVASEREQNTLESLLALRVSRHSIVVTKFLSVLVFSMAAGLLNLLSMMLTIEHTLFLGADLRNITFTIPLASVPLLLFLACLIGSIFSAGMLILAFLAKSFREAQGYISPVYIFTFLPAYVVIFPGAELTWKTALLPISNAALIMRDGIQGVYNIPLILLSCMVLLALSAALLVVARGVIRSESFALAAPAESPFRLVTRYLFRRGTT